MRAINPIVEQIMTYFLLFISLLQIILNPNSVPVLTYPYLIRHHPVIDDLYTVGDVDDLYRDQDLANNIVRLQSEQTHDVEKTIFSTLFLQKLLPSSQSFPEYKPQANKRGGKMFNKRTRY